jgi:hypothetical protein
MDEVRLPLKLINERKRWAEERQNLAGRQSRFGQTSSMDNRHVLASTIPTIGEISLRIAKPTGLAPSAN